jgi:hypothetical protein
MFQRRPEILESIGRALTTYQIEGIHGHDYKFCWINQVYSAVTQDQFATRLKVGAPKKVSLY